MAQFDVVVVWLEALRRCALRQSAAGGDIALGAVSGAAVGEKGEVLTPIALTTLSPHPGSWV